MLSRGAHVDPFSTDHGTPLHVAAKHKQDRAMKILLDHHADVSSIIRFFIVLEQLYLIILVVCFLHFSQLFFAVLSLESGQLQSCEHLEIRLTFSFYSLIGCTIMPLRISRKTSCTVHTVLQ